MLSVCVFQHQKQLKKLTPVLTCPHITICFYLHAAKILPFWWCWYNSLCFHAHSCLANICQLCSPKHSDSPRPEGFTHCIMHNWICRLHCSWKEREKDRVREVGGERMPGLYHMVSSDHYSFCICFFPKFSMVHNILLGKRLWHPVCISLGSI